MASVREKDAAFPSFLPPLIKSDQFMGVTIMESRIEPHQLHRANMVPGDRHPLLTLLSFTSIFVFVVPVILLAGILIDEAVTQTGASRSPIGVAGWFDPHFLSYQILILALCVSVVPVITYCYVTMMKGEKVRHLRRELGPAEWSERGQDIVEYVRQRYRMRRYAGSITIMMLVLLLGFVSLLLFKPVPRAVDVVGVKVGDGLNFLLLGPYVSYFFDETRGDYFERFIISTSAFQFGFLGAYVYFVKQLVRSYFTLDLTPHTFVGNTVRIVTSSFLALVISFLLFPSPAKLINTLPALSFFIGYFPERGLLFLDRWANQIFRLPMVHYSATPLAKLSGMSSEHEISLIREGYDNVENLMHADPLELAIHTGFSYKQLQQWIGESCLRSQLGKDYETFRICTGISTLQQLAEFCSGWIPHEDCEDPLCFLDKATKHGMREKIEIVTRLSSLTRTPKPT